MKRIAWIVGMILAMTILCAGCGTKYKTDGCFVYEIVTATNDEKLDKADYYARIRELSEYGKQQKYIIVPKELGGYPLKEIGYTMIGFPHGEWESEVLEKIYLASYEEIRILDCVFFPCIKLETVLFFYIQEGPLYNGPGGKYFANREDGRHGVNRANVSFRLNYENAENDGFYWIDYLSNEKIDVIPNDPIREGYLFGGWYKEQECVAKWEFGTDIVPIQERDEEGHFIYKETCLYAKWIAE